MTSIKGHLIKVLENSMNIVALFVASILQERAMQYLNFANNDSLA